MCHLLVTCISQVHPPVVLPVFFWFHFFVTNFTSQMNINCLKIQSSSKTWCSIILMIAESPYILFVSGYVAIRLHLIPSIFQYKWNIPKSVSVEPLIQCRLKPTLYSMFYPGKKAWYILVYHKAGFEGLKWWYLPPLFYHFTFLFLWKRSNLKLASM